MRVFIPFKDEMKALILAGKKTCTTRTQCYGSPGDIFTLDGHSFRITALKQWNLKAVSLLAYRQEGFISPQGFIDYWSKLHPRIKYKPDQKVFVHCFSEVNFNGGSWSA